MTALFTLRERPTTLQRKQISAVSIFSVIQSLKTHENRDVELIDLLLHWALSSLQLQCHCSCSLSPPVNLLLPSHLWTQPWDAWTPPHWAATHPWTGTMQTKTLHCLYRTEWARHPTILTHTPKDTRKERGWTPGSQKTACRLNNKTTYLSSTQTFPGWGWGVWSPCN